jgi:hypothetical protein
MFDKIKEENNLTCTEQEFNDYKESIVIDTIGLE